MDLRRAHVLMTLASIIFIQRCSGNHVNLTVTTNIVESVETVTEEVIKNFQLNYSMTDEGLTENDQLLLALCVSVEDTDIAVIHSWDSRVVDLGEQPSGMFNFSLKGLFVGRTYTHLRFVFLQQNGQSPCLTQMAETTPFDLDSHFNLTSELPPDKTAVSFEGRQEIVVIRQHRAIDTAFNVVVVLLVVIVNLGVGCKTDLGVIKATLRRPIAPVTGFFSQFLIMPLISYAAVKAFQFEPALALGFFALGCSPGGSASNAYTMLLDGDVSLSITMTFISTLAALGMVPLWLLTLGRTLYSDTSITIPFQNIFYSLLGLLAPVALGLLIQRRRPRWAKVLVTISKVVMVLFLVFVLTVGVYANLYVFSLITVPVIGAAASLPYVGFVLGGLVAAAFRMPRRHVLTIAVETGIQNTGIAIVLLLLSLHHPESDVSIVAPIISAIFTPLPLWVAIAVVQGRKRCRGGEGGAEGEEGDARQRLKMEGEEDGGGGGVEGEDGGARKKLKMEGEEDGKGGGGDTGDEGEAREMLRKGKSDESGENGVGPMCWENGVVPLKHSGGVPPDGVNTV